MLEIVDLQAHEERKNFIETKSKTKSSKPPKYQTDEPKETVIQTKHRKIIKGATPEQLL